MREYQPRDFPQLCAIDRACFAEGIAYTPEEIALALAQTGAFALVVEAQGQVVGFLLAYSRKQLGHIVTIDLLAGFRRQGIGLRLMQLAEERLRQRRAARIVLE
ncbi:MAG: GNAT family N-acetyltransferase, partial [Acidobacteria bacterium]|nr:GNAT family N-acetyltransferase [Acidobacteriota bacterium]